ncbi:MAG: carbamoyl-phosphate synthase (glutamine-hydrolyzing) large subunit [Oligoflexales bacterium]
MPLLQQIKNTKNPKVLLLGSGGLSIGQAGEFDYSGTQAIKALREEGVEVIVVNPNIATIQTNPTPGVKNYLYPVEPHWVERIIEKERPVGIMASFGGQTALNCFLKLEAAGVLQKYNVLNLATPGNILEVTEDRELFAAHMKKLGMPIPPSAACATMAEARTAAANIGFPVIVRAAYALGGLGSGFATNEEELRALVGPALATSPQVLIEKSLKGFKEVEYEVMRDRENNTITICNMENFDPLGIHTGDSIVVAPSQTLSDDEFQMLRNAAIDIVSSLGIIGECNVQYALDPNSSQFYVIEMNARLSRSSALASKATGYPIAYIAAKVMLGYDLLELVNPVTGVTCAYFEPALDYITVKIPRWDLIKFRGVNKKLGSNMKSVGEVMSIGRSFPEALQKAVRMVTENPEGLSIEPGNLENASLNAELESPTDRRLFHVCQSFREGMTVEEAYNLTKIDKWFLYHLKEILDTESNIRGLGAKEASHREPQEAVKQALKSLDKDAWHRIKHQGFGDEQIAALLLRSMNNGTKVSENLIRQSSLTVRKLRKEKGIVPVVKKIDTTAGEYPSPSNYLYMSYGGLYHDVLPEDKKVFSAIVLGGGTYRIGTSVEFDWCAVSCSLKLQREGWRSIIINCNPETVSTDYNSSDRLYFEELTLERILDIAELEKPLGLIASMGGQLPNKLALPLADAGLKLLGHSHDTIDGAEDRSKFSALLDKLGIDQPAWAMATSKADIENLIEKMSYPVLVRPSYVLSGAAMAVAYDKVSLDACLSLAASVSPNHPVVISQFIEGAREIELDGVAKDGEILTSIVSEHIENAGVHSGDATMVVPPQRLYVETVRRVRHSAKKIVKGLALNGPFNMQFLAKDNDIKVIECNVRAARSFPFVSKVVGINLADVSTDVITSKKPEIRRLNEDDMPYVGVKAAMFSFPRLVGADPVLGVEMASTGEVGCIGETFEEALLLALEASGIKQPKKGVLVSSGTEKEKLNFLKAAQVIKKLGLKIYATDGTGRYLAHHGYEDVEIVSWPDEGGEDAISVIKSGLVDLVVNIPKSHRTMEITRGSQIRKAAMQYGCALLTNMEKVTSFFAAIDKCGPNFVKEHELLVLPDYRTKH